MEPTRYGHMVGVCLGTQTYSFPIVYSVPSKQWVLDCKCHYIYV
jgi:hypothetical protein